MCNIKTLIHVMKGIGIGNPNRDWSFEDARFDDYVHLVAGFAVVNFGLATHQTLDIKITNSHVNIKIAGEMHSFPIEGKTESEVVLDILESGVLFDKFEKEHGHRFTANQFLLKNNIVFRERQFYKFISYVANYKSHLGDSFVCTRLTDNEYCVLETDG